MTVHLPTATSSWGSQRALGAELSVVPSHQSDLSQLLHPKVPLLISRSQGQQTFHLSLAVDAWLQLVVLKVVPVRLEVAA